LPVAGRPLLGSPLINFAMIWDYHKSKLGGSGCFFLP
jgi:hypothetical protein